jgi:hypothetical protein
MSRTMNRREVIAALTATLGAPLVLAESPPSPTPPPPGSARYLIELLAFHPPGAPPSIAYPVAPISAAQTLAGRVEPLGMDQAQLGAAKEALLRKGGFKLLEHLVWAVIVPPNGRTTTHLEDLQTSDPQALTGSLAVQRSQYLFMGIELDYSVAGRTYGLREKRRIKFGERHYFDHPAFGVIATVSPAKGSNATD